MNTAALSHAASGATAYALDAHHLRVVLRAAAGDLDGVTVVWQDRYAAPSAPYERAALARVASDGVSDYWAATLTAATRRIRYAFALRSGRELIWLGEMGPVRRWVEVRNAAFQFPYITTADLFRQPAWLGGITLYQIFPDRFRRGDFAEGALNREARAAERGRASGRGRRRLRWGDRPYGSTEMAGGNLEGIRQSLDHLSMLGVGAFYTTPLFRSPSNHKYDTTDYRRIDPAFGTNEQFAGLVREAHARGVRVLLDAVFNHCGDRFFGFRDVCRRGEASPYRSWFHRIDSFPVDPSLPNYETFANRLGWMPKLNTADPACAEYLLRTAEFWMRQAGIDGWRVDVANEVDHRFWRQFRERVKKLNPEAWIVGEVWHEASLWLGGDQFDSVMNYPFREAALRFLQGESDAREFDQALQRLWYRYPAPVLSGLLNLLGSHDTPRVRTLLGPERARLAAVLLLTCPGVPMVYYGDEIGMEGGPDPDCRRCMEWDPARWDHRTLDLYQRLIRARRERPWLNDGAWETLQADPISGAYLFRRSSRRMLGALPADGPEESLWVALNPGPAPVELELPLEATHCSRLRDILTDENYEASECLPLTLEPFGAQVFVEADGEDQARARV